jgi:hypothetical protein
MTNGAIKLAIGGTALLAMVITHAQAPDAGKPREQAERFSAYKSRIRPLSPQSAKACEGQLRRILDAIDGSKACTADSECTFVSEEPFGQTVSVRAMAADVLLSDMKQFRTSCNNESITPWYNPDLVHVPACVQSRCMVKSSLKR